MTDGPHLIRITSPAWIEIGDLEDWKSLVCDGCGEGLEFSSG